MRERSGSDGGKRTTGHARRRGWQPRQKATRFVATGQAPTLASLLDRIDATGAERVYLVGDRPGGTADGLTAWALGPMPPGWAIADRGHYLHPSRPTLHLVAPDGRTVEILRVASWLGDGDYTAAEAADALRVTLGAIRSAWHDPEIPLLSTPSTQGRDLWLRTIPHGAQIPTLPAAVQDTIRATTTQGRWQRLGPPADGASLDGLHGFDMRFGYGALLRGLPDPATVRVGLDDGDDERAWSKGGPLRYRRGRFRVRVEVPDGWPSLGILPLLDPDHDPASCRRCSRVASAGQWCYPSAGGARFETWADGAELAIAADYGWRFRAVESITFEEGRGLDLWADRLLSAREAVGRHVAPEIARLARGALRMVVLQTVGAMHGRGHRITRAAETADQVPEGAAVSLQGDGLVWHEDTAQAWAETAHPEWSAAIWSRCRARMVQHRGRGVLAVPAARIVAIRQDAIYLTGGAPDWRDDGRVGTLRSIASVHGSRPWPRSTEDLLTIREGAHSE